MAEATDTREATSMRTWRFKVRGEAAAWLNAAAIEVNQVWNYCNETSHRAIRNYVGKSRWLSGFDLCNHTAGACKEFEHIGAGTIQRVCTEYVQKRIQSKRVKLRWRVSRGPRRSLGWIPFKAASIQRHGKYPRFCGKPIRIFEAERFGRIKKWQQSCFSQDAVGDWWLNLPVHSVDESPKPRDLEIGIDLGLKDTATTSDGDRLAAGRYYRSLETEIARAQRRGHKRQAKRLHRQAQRRRNDTIHKFSRRIVNRYFYIYVGDVSSQALIKTRFAKAVLDCGWATLKRQLQYKGDGAGRVVQVVNERNTSRTCSTCGALTGPKGVNELRVRTWTCHACGEVHDRDVNAARNIRSAGRKPPSVRGNEMHCGQAPPSRVECPREAWTVLTAGAF